VRQSKKHYDDEENSQNGSEFGDMHKKSNKNG
jgi:hypothetical protein